MVKITKETFGPVRLEDGFGNSAKLRPLFWEDKGADKISIIYRGTPTPELVTVAERWQAKLEKLLVGQPQELMVKWAEEAEFELEESV